MRKTKIRTDLLNFFDKEDKPRTAAEILAAIITKNPKINKTTIYRELSFLKSIGIITDIVWMDGVIRFEKKGSSCHHHIVCENCGDIEDIVINETPLINKVQKDNKFKIKSHSIEFFGVCKNCI